MKKKSSSSFWRYLYGKNVIKAYIEKIDNNHSHDVEILLSDKNKYKDIKILADKKNIPILYCKKEELDRFFGHDKHRGLLLKVPSSDRPSLKDVLPFPENSVVVILDHIEDPHNIGAIIRTCDKFDIAAVIVPSRRAAVDSPVISKVSSGADAFVPLIVENNLSRVIDILKEDGFWIYGADMCGDSLSGVSFSGKICLVMGSEGNGLSRLVREKCDYMVSIPSGGNIDSFNVSVATGILLYEIVRQQGKFD
ncbi:23S rRNA (guanosine(2251)-2'-O)-methyltransferase RlmB [Spirochaetia bacterium 38H-sp]|uniref:23S rRNA (Guanosine(2251)-2'-O)-methyltransferase RlmB n=1 Tax=Rarispira pelagica TaxID=3141764 RepID=A0ABU9UDR7_9SPIR